MTGDHYFSADPAAAFTRTSFRTEIWGHEATFVTGSGVFSAGHLDPGTAVLFRSQGPPVAGQRYLDLGCGYGVIAASLARARPQAEVWAIDVNQRALLLAAENAASLGLDRVRVTTPDDVPAEVRFDEIWSNPPIRIGKPALHQMLSTWLPRLAPGGRAVWVVGKFLGADSLQRWLTDQGYPTQRVASAKGFRVLETRQGGARL